MPTYLPIGKFVASHGVHGDLILQHTLGKRSNLSGVQALFVEQQKDQFLPWFIERAQPRSESETLVKLEGIDTKEKAQPLARRAVWLSEADFNKQVARSAPVKLLGYHIWEGDRDLGEILELIEQPHQLIGRLEIEGKEVLIPLHADSLEKVDHKKRIVYVTLPEGLLDLYLA